MRSLITSVAVASSAVVLTATAFVVGAHNGAAARPSGGPTKAQVAKIAKKQADKEIAAKAPTLTVANARHADAAGTAATATDAAHAKSADTIGSTSIKTFATEVLNNGPTVTLGTVNGLTLAFSCEAGNPNVTAQANPGGPYEYFRSRPGTPDETRTGGSSFLSSTPLSVNGYPTGGQGAGFFSFAPNTPHATTVTFGWRVDFGNCQTFGTMIGG